MCSLLSHTHCRKISEKIRSEFQLKYIDKSFFRDTEGHDRESDDSSQTDLSLKFRFIELQLGFWGWCFRILDLGTNRFVMIIFVTLVLWEHSNINVGAIVLRLSLLLRLGLGCQQGWGSHTHIIYMPMVILFLALISRRLHHSTATMGNSSAVTIIFCIHHSTVGSLSNR